MKFKLKHILNAEKIHSPRHIQQRFEIVFWDVFASLPFAFEVNVSCMYVCRPYPMMMVNGASQICAMV